MRDSDSFVHITDNIQLQEFCERSYESEIIGFDTEFVSENRYRPELCLIQVATDTEIAIIDTMSVDELSPFWKLLTTGDQITVVHAAREEFLFCFRGCQARPKKMFDIQLASGFIGLDYPASYGNLVSQLLGISISKGETRTDWKRRPLSDNQIAYAIGDVEHLHQLYFNIFELLQKADRDGWYYQEVDTWLDNLQNAEIDPQWHRISGALRLNRRSLAVLRELWILRDSIAASKDRSPKRVIPDDLLVELAKRGSSRPSNFKSIRGFDKRVAKGLTDAIADAIKTANELPDNKLPQRLERGKSVNLGLVGQFLSTILGVVCRTQRIAPSLVGTVQDVRNLAAWRLGQLPKKPVPKLASGWRADIVGDVIGHAIDGKVALRVEDANSDHPLALEKLD